MQEQISEFMATFRSALRFRWYGMCAAWIVALVGWSWVSAMPQFYEASARVYVNTTSVLEQLLGNQIAVSEVESQIDYVRQAMLGSELLQAVLEEVQVDLESMPRDAREDALSELRDSIVIEPIRNENSYPRERDNTFLISHDNTNREQAVTVVSTLLDAFVSYTLGESMRSDEAAEQFLDEQLEQYERRLEVAEAARAQFRRENAQRLPDAEGGYYERLSSANSELADVQRESRILESKRDQLEQQLADESKLISAGEPSDDELPPNSLDAQIRDLERQLALLLLRYTERHSDVIQLRGILELRRAERAERLQELGIEAEDVELFTLASNPVFEALQIELNRTEVDIATVQADIEDRAQEIYRLEELIDELPQVEAQMDQLNRDYEVVNDNYLALVRTRETQELTSRASAAGQEDFRVIDPPFAPSSTSGPPKVLIYVMVFLGALCSGGVLCYACSQAWPVFGRTRVLREATGLPVLGTVSHAWQDRYRSQRRNATIRFLTVFGMLVVAYGYLVWRSELVRDAVASMLGVGL